MLALHTFGPRRKWWLLYHSNLAPNSRDVPGGAVKFTAPTVVNGKVYVGSQRSVGAYGIIHQTPAVAKPLFSLLSGTYSRPMAVALSDPTPSATILHSLRQI